MPSRDANPNRPVRNRADATGVAQTQEEPQLESITGDSAWDSIEEMKGSGGDGKFDKMSTSFFLKEGEKAEVVFIDENPVIFHGHNIKCVSEKGTTFYRTEQCQKSIQDYCVYCDASAQNNAISKANKVIAFRLLDSRGKWDSNKRGLDGNPAPKIFLSPLYFAKQTKALKDEAGEISDKVINISRTGNYTLSYKMNKLDSGGFDYEFVDEAIFNDMEMPEILDVYAPLNDAEATEFMDKFSAKQQQQQQTQAQGAQSPPPRQIGTFGRGGGNGRGR